MKKTLAALGMMCLCAVVSFGSTINTSTASTGTTFSGFDNGGATQAQLAGATAAVGGDICTFIAVAGNSTCTGIGFVITLQSAVNATVNNWNVFNKASAGDMSYISALTINLQPANTVFHACSSGAAIVEGSCGHGGGSVSDTNQPSSVAADVAYTNLANDLLTGGGHPFDPLYGRITLTWAPMVFTGGVNFNFDANVDLFGPATASAPEPATYGMVGLTLVGLGALRLRRRKAAKVT